MGNDSIHRTLSFACAGLFHSSHSLRIASDGFDSDGTITHSSPLLCCCSSGKHRLAKETANGYLFGEQLLFEDFTRVHFLQRFARNDRNVPAALKQKNPSALNFRNLTQYRNKSTSRESAQLLYPRTVRCIARYK